MKRRHLILLVGGASSGALSVGTGAFSSAQMERGVNVNVADDENAFVRYDTPSDEAVIEQGGERITLVRIRNQFGGNQKIALVGVEIDADPDVLSDVEAERKLTSGNDPADPEDVEAPDGDEFESIENVTIVTEPDADDFPDPDEEEAFGPGNWARVVADANPNPGQEVDIEVTITVKGIEGTGVTARIFGDTRTFTIEGEEIDPVDDVTGVKFPGDGGNPKIETESIDGTVSARAYYREQGNSSTVYKTDFFDVDVNESLGVKDFGHENNGPTIVGIDIDGISDVFKRPDESNDKFVEPGQTQSASDASGDDLADDD